MPIYEFYCADCHVVFNFLARRPDTEKRPACPRCGRPRLSRQISRFSIGRRRAASGGPDEPDDLPPDVDEARMERLFDQMARDMEGVDENDPRQMARMLHKLYEAGGLPMGEGMREALRRMEAGEDPDRIEEEMGDLLEEEGSLLDEHFEGEPQGGRLRSLSRRFLPPEHDETLYEL